MSQAALAKAHAAAQDVKTEAKVEEEEGELQEEGEQAAQEEVKGELEEVKVDLKEEREEEDEEAAQEELDKAAEQEMLAMAELELANELRQDEAAKRRKMQPLPPPPPPLPAAATTSSSAGASSSSKAPAPPPPPRRLGEPWREGRAGGRQRWGSSGGSNREYYRGYYLAKGRGRDALEAYMDIYGPPPTQGGQAFHQKNSELLLCVHVVVADGRFCLRMSLYKMDAFVIECRCSGWPLLSLHIDAAGCYCCICIIANVELELRSSRHGPPAVAPWRSRCPCGGLPSARLRRSARPLRGANAAIAAATSRPRISANRRKLVSFSLEVCNKAMGDSVSFYAFKDLAANDYSRLAGVSFFGCYDFEDIVARTRGRSCWNTCASPACTTGVPPIRTTRSSWRWSR